jgi:MFS family permease
MAMATWIRVVGGVLRDRRLRVLLTAFLGFNIAEYGVWVALLVYAYAWAGAVGAGVVALAQLVPAALVAPLGAYAGDRFPRGRVLLLGYLAQAVTLLATAAAIAAGAPALVVVVTAATTSVALTFTRPTHYALLPDVTASVTDLTGANAVSGLAESLGMLLGPFITGLLLATWGPASAFTLFGGVVLVSVAQLVGMQVSRVAIPPSPVSARDVLGETLRGFGVLRTEPAVRLPIAVLATAQVVVGALDVLLVATAIDLLGAGASWAGFLTAAFGLGGIVGALLAVSLAGRRRLTPPLAGGAVLLGGPIVAMGALPSMATAPWLVGLCGAGRSVAAVSGNTLLQRAAPASALARVFGVLEGLTMAALAVGTVGASLLVTAFGIAPALMVVGAFAPLVVMVLWRPLRAVEREARAPEAQLLALVRSLPIFAPLPAPAIERVLGSLERLDTAAGEVLIREGDPGDRFYILAEGSVDITLRGERIAVRRGVDILGEIALLHDIPRTATVVATSPLVLYALDREPFLEAVTGHPQVRAIADAAIARRLGQAPRG